MLHTAIYLGVVGSQCPLLCCSTQPVSIWWSATYSSHSSLCVSARVFGLKGTENLTNNGLNHIHLFTSNDTQRRVSQSFFSDTVTSSWTLSVLTFALSWHQDGYPLLKNTTFYYESTRSTKRADKETPQISYAY